MAKQEKIVKNFPASSGRGVECKTTSGQKYYITQDVEKGKHTLWKKVPEGYQQISVAESPYDLYPLVDWDR